MSERTAAGFRARLMAAVLVAAIIVVSGAFLERALGPRPLEADEAPADVSGAWFCPHGGGGWRTWVVVANPSDRGASLRVLTYGSSSAILEEATVGPGSQVYLEVPAEDMASGTSVEFFGAPVAAGMVSAREERGMAAEPCLEEPGTTWFLADGTTERGFSQRVVIMNPFADRAVFDLTLVSEDEIIRTGELTGMVLPPRRASAVNLGEFALGQRSLGALVEVRFGRVVAGAVGLSQRGLRTTVGTSTPGRTWVLPGAADRDPSELIVLAPRVGVPFRVRAQGSDEQVEVVGEADVPSRSVDTLELQAQGRSLVVVAEGDQPFVAARRLARGDDRAATAGVVGGAARWVAVPALPPEGGVSFLVVENPGDEVAQVGVTFLTGEGRAEAPSLARLIVPAGRSLSVPLDELVGNEPVSALVEATQGVVVVAQAAHVSGGYAVAIGVPIEPLG